MPFYYINNNIFIHNIEVYDRHRQRASYNIIHTFCWQTFRQQNEI